jgi:hypothetical protein
VPAPHRGDANKPITNQGKANAVGTQTNKRREGKQLKESPTPQAYRRTKRRAGIQIKQNLLPEAYKQKAPPKAKTLPIKPPAPAPASSSGEHKE